MHINCERHTLNKSYCPLSIPFNCNVIFHYIPPKEFISKYEILQICHLKAHKMRIN